MLLLLVTLELSFVYRAFGRIGRKRLLALGNSLDQLRRWEILHDLAGVHAKGAKGSEASVNRVIVDLFRMQLLIDPFVHPNRGHTLDIARTGTERKPVERVQRAFLLIHFDRGRTLLIFIGEGELDAKRKAEEGYGSSYNELSSREAHVEAESSA